MVDRVGRIPDVDFKTVLIGSEETTKIERPTGFGNEVYVLYWPDANLVIPWPEGMTMKQAVARWLGTEETTAPNTEEEVAHESAK